jgi:hypothetical protein
MPLPTIFSDFSESADPYLNLPDYEILKKDGWDIFNKNSF